MLYEVLHFMAEREKYGSLNLGLDNSSQIKKDTNNAVGITSTTPKRSRTSDLLLRRRNFRFIKLY